MVAITIVEAEIRRAEDAINAAYWAFTRQARAKPPCLVVPQAYTDRRELVGVVRALRQRLVGQHRQGSARFLVGRS